MKIELTRADDAYHFISTNEDGNTIATDVSLAIGGNNQGMRPMQLVLAAVASCSSIDIVMILKKQRQDLKDIKVTIEGKRAENQTPAVFTDIHIHYRLYGNIKEKKAEQAVSLSIEKYCSVSKMLEASVNITYDFEVIPS